MGIKGFVLQVKIIGNKRIFILRENCMGVPIKIRIRHPKENEKELVGESESLEDIIKILKRLDKDLRGDGFQLYFDKLPYKPNSSSLELLKALDSKSINEELMIFGKIADEEKERLKFLFVETQEVLI